MTPRKRRRKPKPYWERGYFAHGYWQGKQKLGTVTLDPAARPEAKYRWQASTHAGVAATLRDAKRSVEATVLLGARQLALFPTSDEIPV